MTAGPVPAKPANASAIRNIFTRKIWTSSCAAAYFNSSPPRDCPWAKIASRNGYAFLRRRLTIIERHELVGALREKLDLREDLAVTGEDLRVQFKS